MSQAAPGVVLTQVKGEKKEDRYTGILVQMPGAAQLSFSFKDADVGDVVFELQGGAEADA